MRNYEFSPRADRGDRSAKTPEQVLAFLAEEYESVEAEYKKTQEALQQVGGDIKAYQKKTETLSSELRARVQELEQIVAANVASGTCIASSATYAPMAATAMQELESNLQFANLKNWNQGTCRVNMAASIRAALVTDGAGSSNDSTLPRNPQRGSIVAERLRPLRLLEVLPSRPVATDSVEFVQLRSDGGAEEQVAQGAEKASTEFSGELVRADIVTIAVHTTASKQVLGDNAALRQSIDNVLRHKTSARLEHQIINGEGGQGKIDGLLNQATVLVPSIAEAPADVIGEAITLMQNNGYQPNLIIMSPLDWFRIQITKTETEEDYVFGSPTAPVPPALWNLPVVVTPSMPERTALVLDTSLVTVLDREQPSVLLSNSHQDYFTRNLVAILGELRAGLEVLDTGAVVKVELGAVSSE